MASKAPKPVDPQFGNFTAKSPPNSKLGRAPGAKGGAMMVPPNIAPIMPASDPKPGGGLHQHVVQQHNNPPTRAKGYEFRAGQAATQAAKTPSQSTAYTFRTGQKTGGAVKKAAAGAPKSQGGGKYSFPKGQK